MKRRFAPRLSRVTDWKSLQQTGLSTSVASPRDLKSATRSRKALGFYKFDCNFILGVEESEITCERTRCIDNSVPVLKMRSS